MAKTKINEDIFSFTINILSDHTETIIPEACLLLVRVLHRSTSFPSCICLILIMFMINLYIMLNWC
jgi:hypothetical protein